VRPAGHPNVPAVWAADVAQGSPTRSWTVTVDGEPMVVGIEAASGELALDHYMAMYPEKTRPIRHGPDLAVVAVGTREGAVIEVREASI
jgi:hypothetical protein